MLQADLYNKLSDAKELTFGLPPSRLGRADASIALLSLLPSIVISTVVELSSRLSATHGEIPRQARDDNVG